MNNWKNKVQDIGEVIPGKKYVVVFSFEKLKHKVVRVEVACGCTQAKYHENLNNVSVVYTPKPIPVHLRFNKSFPHQKTITLYLENGEVEYLTIKATTINKK